MDYLYEIDKRIEEEYDLNINSLEEKKYKIVGIINKENSNNNDVILKEDNAGFLWVIYPNKYLNDKLILIPKNKSKSKFTFTSNHFKILKQLFNFDQYDKDKTRKFILEKPAKISSIGGDWKLVEHGILNFGKKRTSFSSSKSEQNKSQQASITTENIRQINNENKNPELIKALQNENNELKNKVEELKEKLEQEQTSRQIIYKEQTSIEPKLFKESIKKVIDEYFRTDFPIQYPTVNETIINKISNQKWQYLESQLSYIQQLIIEKHDNYFSKDNTQTYSSTVEQNNQLLNLKIELIEQLQNEVKQEIVNQLKPLQNSINTLESKLQKSTTDDNMRLNLEFQDNLNLMKDLINKFNSISQTFFTNFTVDEQQLEIISKKTKEINNIAYLIKFPQSDKDIEFLEQYNNHTRSLLNNATKVAATRESIEQIRSGIKTPLLFKKDVNDSYWILNEPILKDGFFYLVPKANLIINDRIYQTVEDIFTCQGYKNRSSNKFKLSRPAIVQLSDRCESEWELVQPGELEFA